MDKEEVERLTDEIEMHLDEIEGMVKEDTDDPDQFADLVAQVDQKWAQLKTIIEGE